MKIAVINNREGLVQGQLQPTGKDSNGMAILGPLVTLLPGLNLVDKDKLEALRKNPTFELNFTQEIKPSPAPEQNPEKVGKPTLEVLCVEQKTKEGVLKKPIEVEDELPLAKLDEATIKRIVSETLVADTLRLWSRQDARPAVRWEIEQQLQKIGAAPAGPASVS